MSTTTIHEIDNQLLLKCLEDLQKLRHETGDPSVFWSQYIETLREVVSAEAGVVAVRGLKDGASWQPVVFSPKNIKLGAFAKTIFDKLDPAADACAEKGSALLEEPGYKLTAVNLRAGADAQTCLAVFYFPETRAAEADASLKILKVLNDIPANYQLCKSAYEAMARQEQFAGILELMMMMNTQDRFLSSAMTYCNELSSRHRCERVSLGWFKDGYIRLQTMSHVDDFDKKMEIVQKLEMAMEESYDQDADIVWPLSHEDKTIARDHEAFAKSQNVSHMASFPLRAHNEIVGVCTFERNETAFQDNELRLFRLYCDQAVRRLQDLKDSDRWFGARWASALKKKLEGLLGYKHTWAKAIGISVFILMVFLCFIPITYRLESPVILRTDDVAYLTAPFDGHIEEVKVRISDKVDKNADLLLLDQKDLLLEEAGLMAEKNRYKRESEKARAANALADMRISDALYEQSAARLELVRYKLSQSVIKSPYNGVVVEGDLMERVGSPVKQGDVLFKIGRIDKMYAELEVRESEIHNVTDTLDGQIALASRPQDTYDIKVMRIEPAAVAKEKGNVFLVHCQLTGEAPDWWKPGMTGISKLNAGKRTLLWILTHRTMDFLRLKLWW